jgi:hypothetical protein
VRGDPSRISELRRLTSSGEFTGSYTPQSTKNNGWRAHVYLASRCRNAARGDA